MCFDYIISWYKNLFCRDEDEDEDKDKDDNYQLFPGDETCIINLDDCEFCCCF